MKLVLSWVLALLITFFGVCAIRSCFQLDYINREIKEFKSRGVLMEQYSTSSNKIYFVKPDFDLKDDLTYYKDSNNCFYPGGIGDIIATKRLSFDLPFIKDILCFYVGGHAAMSGYGTTSIEATGVGSFTGIVMGNKDFLNNLYDEYMCYRVRYDRSVRERAYEACKAYLGQDYNYSFVFDCHNKKYCSDLISSSYKDIGIEFYNNFIATTVFDLVANPYTYLTYYSNVENGVRSTYILANF